MNIDEVVKKVNEIIKNDEEYKIDKNMKVQYILLDKNKNIGDIVCFGDFGMIDVDPKTFEIGTIPDWAYLYDVDIFEKLVDGETIAYMNYEIHYDIWRCIRDWYPEDIECKEGLELYIKYCDEKGITKEYLDKRMETNETPDIMENFTELGIGELLNYKGYIAYVDKENVNNDKENIVYIYKSNQDYIDGNSIESVSLNKNKLKKNIKDYIDKNYSSKVNENPNYESEKAYFTFVLGYDLLQDMFKSSTIQECDKIYDFCDYEAGKFLDSNEYLNPKYSSYEMLEEWINKNKKMIINDYKDMTGGEQKNYNGNMIILDKGFKKDQPVALIEKTLSNDEKEYIVAMYYKVDNDKLTWEYAYYYDNDREKAEKQYNKAISNGNLTHSFYR